MYFECISCVYFITTRASKELPETLEAAELFRGTGKSVEQLRTLWRKKFEDRQIEAEGPKYPRQCGRVNSSVPLSISRVRNEKLKKKKKTDRSTDRAADRRRSILYTLYIPSAVLLSSRTFGNVATRYESDRPCCKKNRAKQK